MIRFIVSLLVGILLGIGAGLFLGWVPFPVEYVNSPASALAPQYQNEYTVMIAKAFLNDEDDIAAVERLRMLQVENIPLHVQTVTETYITTSQALEDIRALVALSEALGRLTPIMEPYREVALPGEIG